MAIRDHKAPVCPSVSSGNAFSVSPTAGPPATSSAPASLRLSTVDDVAFALYALTQLSLEDQRHRQALRHLDAPTLIPLPSYFRQGVVVAMQCLDQYARQLGQKQALNA